MLRAGPLSISSLMPATPSTVQPMTWRAPTVDRISSGNWPACSRCSAMTKQNSRSGVVSPNWVLMSRQAVSTEVRKSGSEFWLAAKRILNEVLELSEWSSR